MPTAIQALMVLSYLQATGAQPADSPNLDDTDVPTIFVFSRLMKQVGKRTPTSQSRSSMLTASESPSEGWLWRLRPLLEN